MNTKQTIQIVGSLIFGLAIYYGYRLSLFGMNPLVMPVFGVIIFALLVINILQIKRTKNRLYPTITFLILGLILPIVVGVNTINSTKPEAQERQYSKENINR